MFMRLIGITGLILILYGFNMLWISPDAELSEVVTRTETAICLSLAGSVMIVFYLYKRQS